MMNILHRSYHKKKMLWSFYTVPIIIFFVMVILQGSYHKFCFYFVTQKKFMFFPKNRFLGNEKKKCDDKKITVPITKKIVKVILHGSCHKKNYDGHFTRSLFFFCDCHFTRFLSQKNFDSKFIEKKKICAPQYINICSN